MSKPITYRKVTRERFIELLERIDYKVTKQSSDGTHMLIRLPNGKPTDYWLFLGSLEHRLDDFRGGSYFKYEQCKLLFKHDTVALIDKNSKSESIFVQFHNFDKKAGEV